MADFSRAVLFIGTATFLVFLAGAEHHHHGGYDMERSEKMDKHHEHCSMHSSCEECMNSQGCAWCSSGTARCGSDMHLREPGKCDYGALLFFQNSSVLVSPKPPKGPMRPKFTKVALRQGDKVQVEAFLKIPMDAKLKRKKKGSILKLKIKNIGPFDMQVAANCSGKFISKKKMLLCTDVEKGQTIRINATVSLTTCTDKPGIIVVKAAGLRKAKTKVIVKPLCKCEHHMPKRIRKPGGKKDRVKKKKDKKDKKDKKKDKKDKRKKDRKRKKDKKKDKKHKKDRKGKKHHLVPSTCKLSREESECSGRGRCVQGNCLCPKHFSGQFCECSDLGCPAYGGATCGGPARGKCECGKCLCLPRYIGEACQESLANDKCISSSGLLCNGKGECKNGNCVCQDPYKGATCEDCPTCQGKCEEFQSCVQCFAFKSGPLTQIECMTRCRKINTMINTFDKIDVNDPNHKLCVFRDDDGCNVEFTYQQPPGPRMQTLVKVRRVKECPHPHPGLAP